MSCDLVFSILAITNGTRLRSGRLESTFDIGNLLAKDIFWRLSTIHPALECCGWSGGTTEHYRAEGSPYNGMMRVGGM